MSGEHLIRLRGAWTCQADGDDEGRRIDLPTDRPVADRSVRLARPFGRPRIDPARESLAIRFEAIDGLREVRLNGVVLARPPAGTTRLEVPLAADLPARNVLELDVEPVPATAPAEWGSIAIVITRD